MNEMFYSVFIICLLLGCLVGFLAGLLGIGGGLVIVPVLIYILPLVGVEPSVVLPVALATSLASIIFTSTIAAFVHHRQRNIPWGIAKRLMVFVAIGALVGAYIASILSAKTLTTLFATAVLVLATYMLVSSKSNNTGGKPSDLILRCLGLFTGILSSLMGIAGGIVLVPSLSYFRLALRQTIAVATVCGVMVAIFGSIGYTITGWGDNRVPAGSIGYIYLPALFGIILTSSVFARYGVKLATKLPVSILKKCFAAFLFLVALNMIFK